MEFKCGYVTIIGNTNVGKSTLINRIVGEKVAIVSPKAQTSRDNTIGIYNAEKEYFRETAEIKSKKFRSKLCGLKRFLWKRKRW